MKSVLMDGALGDETYSSRAGVSNSQTVDRETVRRALTGTARRFASYSSFLRWDRPSMLFILSAVVGGFIMRLQTVEIAFGLKAFVADLSVFSLLSALTLLVSPRRRLPIYLGISGLFTFLLMADTFYFRSHESILSLFLVGQLKFLPQVADACVALFQWSDLLYFGNFVLLVVGMILLKRRGHFNSSAESKSLRIKKIVSGLLVTGMVWGVLAIQLSGTEKSRLSKHWNRPYLVERFGAYGYHLSDLAKYTSARHGISPVEPEEYNKVLSFFKERAAKPKAQNQYTGILQGQNLVFIHAESVQTQFMFKQINGEEITPNLNRIARHSLFFDNFHSQQSSGTSSDSEFTLNTSLFPIDGGTVYISHSDHTFVTLPKKLKEHGYATMSFHGNNASFWNRELMNETMGYDQFYAKRDFVIDEVIGLGLSDMSFFRQTLDVLEDAPQPFYATAIMLTNHTPFTEVDKYGPFDAGNMEGTNTGNYIKSLHYADKSIGYVFDELEKRGMLENTTFIIYGDHPANLRREEIAQFLGQERLSLSDHRRYKTVPFLIYSKRIEEARRVHTPMGMIDVFPTLANMLGVDNAFALGSDIFDIDTNTVVFPDGSWIDENIQFVASSMNFQIFNEAFVDAFRREACAVARSNGVDCPVMDISRRVFSLVGDKDGQTLAAYARRYIASRTSVGQRTLDISTSILAHDLLAPSSKVGAYSLAEADIQPFEGGVVSTAHAQVH